MMVTRDTVTPPPTQIESKSTPIEQYQTLIKKGGMALKGLRGKVELSDAIKPLLDAKALSEEHKLPISFADQQFLEGIHYFTQVTPFGQDKFESKPGWFQQCVLLENAYHQGNLIALDVLLYLAHRQVNVRQQLFARSLLPKELQEESVQKQSMRANLGLAIIALGKEPLSETKEDPFSYLNKMDTYLNFILDQPASPIDYRATAHLLSIHAYVEISHRATLENRNRCVNYIVEIFTKIERFFSTLPSFIRKEILSLLISTALIFKDQKNIDKLHSLFITFYMHDLKCMDNSHEKNEFMLTVFFEKVGDLQTENWYLLTDVLRKQYVSSEDEAMKSFCLSQLERIETRSTYAMFCAKIALMSCFRQTRSMANTLKAIDCYEEASKLADELKRTVTFKESPSTLYTTAGDLLDKDQPLKACTYYQKAMRLANQPEEVIKVLDIVIGLKKCLLPTSPLHDKYNEIASIASEKLNTDRWIRQFAESLTQDIFTRLQAHFPHPNSRVFYASYYESLINIKIENAIKKENPVRALLELMDLSSQQSHSLEMDRIGKALKKYILENFSFHAQIKSVLFTYISKNKNVTALQEELLNLMGSCFREAKTVEDVHAGINFFHERLTHAHPTLKKDTVKAREDYCSAVSHLYRTVIPSETFSFKPDEKFSPKKMHKIALKKLVREHCIPASQELSAMYFASKKVLPQLYMEATIALLSSVGSRSYVAAHAKIKSFFTDKKYSLNAIFFLNAIDAATVENPSREIPDPHMYLLSRAKAKSEINLLIDMAKKIGIKIEEPFATPLGVSVTRRGLFSRPDQFVLLNETVDPVLLTSSPGSHSPTTVR